MIKNLNADVRLEVISRVSDSIREQSSGGNDSWKDFFGAYNPEQSAQEIKVVLRSSCFTNHQICGFVNYIFDTNICKEIDLGFVKVFWAKIIKCGLTIRKIP